MILPLIFVMIMSFKLNIMKRIKFRLEKTTLGYKIKIKKLFRWKYLVRKTHDGERGSEAPLTIITMRYFETEEECKATLINESKYRQVQLVQYPTIFITNHMI